MDNTVRVWEEEVNIPTYGTGKPEKNPMFLEKRIYQGSSGTVYPHPVIEKILDEKKDQVYNAVFIENEYLKIMILPELGGRVQMAWDKVQQRHFIYYNQVIKPALVGLTGPWISGGIEFNWPQHHRPSTFEPVDYTIAENEDGSKTIWVNEVELMFRTKGMAGFTLYPGKAYLEIKGKLYNRTPFPQTFLWWANPAVKVNDHYQSIFPPDVFAVFDHGKRDVSTFPIATGTYYKVDYSPGTDISRYKNIPVPTKDIPTNELLYLNGLHIEQYRHATYTATDYYEEALRRDESDIRNNNALGLWYLRKGKFDKAQPYFRKAIETLTARNPNPYDGEPFYNLGMALKMQCKWEEAYDAFYKSTWNDAWQHAGFFALASIACVKKDYPKALELANQSLIKNWHSPSVRHLKTALLRKNGHIDKALQLIEESLAIDAFNYGCRFEQYIILLQQGKIKEAKTTLNDVKKLMRSHVHNYIECALDYTQAGLYEEAVELLTIYTKEKEDIYPMVYYYLGYFALQLSQHNEALLYFKKASAMKPGYCFPHRLEDISVLETAMKLNPQDAKAPYYLGNLWYDKRQYKEAIENWEKSAALDKLFPTVFRNLALAYHNKLGRVNDALACMEKAFYLDTTDARILMELDQLHKKINTPVVKRLTLLEKHPLLVEDRDDLYLEKTTLLNTHGSYENAKDLLAIRHFHPWEGGEGKVVGQFLLAYAELAKKMILKKYFQRALDLLKCTEYYPHNLGEGKLYGAQENDIHYLKGCVYEGLKIKEKAVACFKKATVGISEPVQAIFYNDPQPDKIFYQGLAWLKLGENTRASDIFNRLIQFGNEHLNDPIQIDYFAVSLPDLLVFDQDLDIKNKLHCLYMIGLGNLGLEKYDEAELFFKTVLDENVNHQGAMVHLDMINYLKNFDSLV